MDPGDATEVPGPGRRPAKSLRPGRSGPQLVRGRRPPVRYADCWLTIWMHPDLAAVVEADEEARARVSAARAERERRIEAARAERAARDAAALDAARREVEAEAARVVAEATAEAGRREVARRAWLEARREQAEGRLDEAAELWARLVEGEDAP